VTTGGTGRIDPYNDLTWTQAGLFFLHDALNGAGTELWITDGTTAGTRLVLDIGPGPISGPVAGTLTAVVGGSQLLLGATDLANGLQLWLSDGTAAGTTRVSTFGGPGHGAVSFDSFFASGTRTFFAANDGVNGVEPWLFDPTGTGVAFALPYGTGCRGTPGVPGIGAAGLPELGNAAFAITVAGAQPASLAFLEASFASSRISIGGCRLLLALPLIHVATPVTDALGAAIAPMPLPAEPTLGGLNLFFQWGVADPAGGIFGAFAASNGLHVQIGG
jgi:ELWxxDGT repeat protein